MIDDVFIGTELKINVNIAPIDGVSMDDYDFEVEFYCSTKKILVFKKADAIRIDNSNYMFCIDTNQLSSGNLKCKVTAFIPDGDFEDLLRTEVQKIDTGINIVKAI